MKNQLMKTDTIWYKIKSFFRKIFFRNNSKVDKTEEKRTEELNKEQFKKELSFRNEIEIKNNKEEVAEKLREGELNVYELSDEQVDEMTEYFFKDIEEIDKELLRIKEHIIDMQKQLAKK